MEHWTMRYLLTVVALGLCACGSADDIVAAGATSSIDARSNTAATSSIDARSSTNVTSSVNSSNSTSVTSSTNVGSTTSMTNSTTTSSGTTSCSADNDGKRCEVSCRSPQLAQCRKGANAAEPTCVCR